MSRLLTLLLLLAFSLNQLAFAEKKPLKIYILVGQSNMQGMANASTLPFMAEDPKTKPLLDKILDKDGKPKIYENVNIAAFSGISPDKVVKKQGKLTIGYGRALGEDDVFGPELGFGIAMSEQSNEPILLIKTAWGGKSLHTDFRPPSAGPYELPAATQAIWDKNPNGAHGVPSAAQRDEWWKVKKEETGQFYQLMIKCVKEVLADPAKYCPTYDPNQGYEIAGFAWFQGWNDMVDSTTYPHVKSDRFKSYSDTLAHFIRDVRKELNAPNMLFTIGVMGVGGSVETVKNDGGKQFRIGMAAPAEMPEFKGNVFSVQTGKFWEFDLDKLDELNKQAKDEWAKKIKEKDLSKLSKEEQNLLRKEETKFIKDRSKELILATFSEDRYNSLLKARSNAAYHYYGCAKILFQVGQELAKALITKQNL